jgi:membrane fusion protein (multidrug efflux system)
MSQTNTIARDKPAAAARSGTAPIRRANRARLLRPILMFGGVLIVIIGALFFWLAGGRYASSDDTYVDAAKVALSTDVSGLVAGVYVKDNEHVVAGQILFTLSPSTFAIDVQNAKAQLAQAVLDINSAKQGYAGALAEIAAQKVQIANDEANLARYAAVIRNGGVTKATYETAGFTLRADQAKLTQLEDEAGLQLAKLNDDPDIAAGDTPEYQSAQAKLNSALLSQSDAIVRAPFSGYVTQVEQLQPGMFLPAGTSAFGLVSDTDVFITAQPKESDITWTRVGQTVDITVDTYPGHKWTGVVESISPASGSEFSILPAQNSSGNWVKVVQRIPLRIKITGGPADLPLRDGMSAEVSIDTNHHRHLSDLF